MLQQRPSLGGSRIEFTIQGVQRCSNGMGAHTIGHHDGDQWQWVWRPHNTPSYAGAVHDVQRCDGLSNTRGGQVLKCPKPKKEQWRLMRRQRHRRTKEASRRVGPHLGGNHSGFQRFLVSETHGACGLVTQIDSDRQGIGRACRAATFTARTILGSWRSSNCAGFVGGHLSHLEDICWACADTLSAASSSLPGMDKRLTNPIITCTR